MIDRVKELQLRAQDIATNANKLLADVPYYQDCDIMIRLHNNDARSVEVVQRYVPEGIVMYYNEDRND